MENRPRNFLLSNKLFQFVNSFFDKELNFYKKTKISIQFWIKVKNIQEENV